MASKGFPIILLALLLLFSWSIPCRAQDEGKSKELLELERLEAARKKREALKAAAVRNPSIGDPELLVEAYRDSFRHWPRHEQGKDAVREVLKGGKDTAPFLAKLLDDRDYRMKPALAYMLGRLGYVEAKDQIEELLDDPHLKASARHILQALHQLDKAHAEGLAQKLLGSKDKALRNAAFSLLNSKRGVDPVPLESLRALLESRDGDIRHKAFSLLKRKESEALDEVALNLVGDDYPTLAGDVCLYLGTRNNPAVIEGLRTKLTFEPERAFAFALASLVELESNFNLVLLIKEDFEKLRPFLNSRDPLLKVSAAAALGSICLRSNTDEDANLIHNNIVPALMEVFLPNRYFRDHACMLDVSFKPLRKMTGYPFGKDLSLWREWWTNEGKDFVEHRFLITLDSSQYPSTVVAYRGKLAEKEYGFSLAGSTLINNTVYRRGDRTFYLSSKDMGNLIEFLYGRGFFSRRSESGEGGADQALPVIRMSVEANARQLSPEGGEDADFTAMEKRLVELYWNNYWQLLYPGGDLRAWWEIQYAWWRENVEEEARVNRFIELLIAAFPILSQEMVLECCGWLEENEALPRTMTLGQAVTLLDKLGDRYTIDPLVERVVGLLNTCGNREFFKPLVHYLYANFESRSFPMLARSALELNCLEEAFQSDKWFVRVVAAQAAPQSGQNFLPYLKALLHDDWPQVRGAAVRALADLEYPENLPALQEIMASEDLEATATLLDALKGRREEWVLDFYEQVLKEGESILWPLALEGLAAFRSDRAAKAVIIFIRKLGLDSELAQKGVTALMRVGGEEARIALFDLLETCEDKDLANDLIFALADLGETKIFPRLHDFILEQRLRSRALDAMIYLLVTDFGDEIWKYREVWNKSRDESQAFFLSLALGVQRSSAPNAESFEGIPIFALVKALNDERWYVRKAALRILEEGAGQSFGRLEKGATEGDRVAVTAAWSDWYRMR